VPFYGSYTETDPV